MLVYLALTLGFLYSAVEYFNSKYKFLVKTDKVWKRKIVSLAAGASIAYLFLHMAPQVISNGASYGKAVFIYPLIGFSLFHMVEMLIFKENKRSLLYKHLNEVHIAALFAYHVGAGFVLLDLLEVSIWKGVLLFFILIVFSLLVAIPKHAIHSHGRIRGIRGKLVASGGFLGVLTASMMPVRVDIFVVLYGLVVGFMFFIVIRETVPPESKGNPLYFALGVITLGVVSMFI